MSLLRRIEGQRPAGTPEAPAAPGAPNGPDQGPLGSQAPTAGPLTQTVAPARDVNRDLRGTLQTRSINNLDPRLNPSDVTADRTELENMLTRFIEQDGTVTSRVER